MVTAQDLTDRVLDIELQPIEYREEAEINESFNTALPELFGALMDLFVKTLAFLPKVSIDKPPRMADFTRLGEAMMQSQGFKAGTFHALYKNNRAESMVNAMESSPAAVALREMVDNYKESSDVVFHGTMKTLLGRLEMYRGDSRNWPGSPRGLGDVLKRQAPALAAIGINIEHGAVTRIDNSRGVAVTITRSSGNIGNVDQAFYVPEKKIIDYDSEDFFW